MRLQLKLFWWGLLIYAVSFVLLAVGPSGDHGASSLPGVVCAFYAFVLPINFAWGALFHNVPMDMGVVPYVSLLISGWVNPAFLITAFFDLAETHPHMVRILKVAVVAMIPFTWLFFASFPVFYPREGHFLWAIGMLVVMFSKPLARFTDSRAPTVVRFLQTFI